MNKPLERMTADEFVSWAMTQELGRFELIDGLVVKMNSEQSIHARVKLNVAIALRDALRRSGARGEVFGDGMAVRINETTVHEPDALVRLGDPLSDEAVLITDPVIVVEVLSPSTGPVDTSTKLANYFSVPSVLHYLVFNTKKRLALHYFRDEAGRPQMRTVTDGGILLTPPGISIALSEIFG
jgi:Uma2 family endonuclease